jgi:hypothetical protein
MKSLIFGALALALVTVANLSPALAEGPRPSGGNTWHGMSQPIDTGPASAVTASPHYELQHHYAGHHPRWMAQWVLVR